ncbi:hypothetical protein [Pseudonocardia sp. ICBG601]|uniref:hypothetical protein n=1 Tax=Pseudonocardia sp. ICBG601 TaxID=2846759 RepID=UPI001CF6B1DC|nr:hypothetical protein [Pseudonocardia sp. ICBG601]
MPFVRKVKTASGATAVQVVEKRHGVRRIVAHVGSAHDDAELAVLIASARDRIHASQQALDLDTPAAGGAGGAIVTESSSEVLWNVLIEAYRRLGFDQLADEAFRALVLARIVEPTSKSAAVGSSTSSAWPRRTATPSPRRCAAAWTRTTEPPSPPPVLRPRAGRVRCRWCSTT